MNLWILQNSMQIFNFQLKQVDHIHIRHSLFSPTPVQITLESVSDLLRLLHDFTNHAAVTFQHIFFYTAIYNIHGQSENVFVLFVPCM